MYHYYGVTFVNQKNSLMHYGIQGMKWGIRRFQNEDGSLTEEGKKRYGQTADELRQNLRKAEREADEARSKYAQKKAKKFFTTDIAIRRAEKKWGEAEKKLSEIRKVAEEYEKRKEAKDKKESVFLNEAKLSTLSNSIKNQCNEVLKNRPVGFTKTAEKLIDKISRGEILSKQEKDSLNKEASKEHFKADDLEDLSKRNERRHNVDFLYTQAPTIDRENEYLEYTKNEKDRRFIDPSYLKFNSKEEKAKAEEMYLRRMGETDDLKTSEEITEKLHKNYQHLSDRVCNLSYDGYEGTPVSERNKALFEEVDGFEPFSTYENYIPKYQKTNEWKDLQKKRESIENANNLSLKTYSEKINAIRKAEKLIQEPFNKQIMKNVLLDMGYEVNERNMELIAPWIWWD